MLFNPDSEYKKYFTSYLAKPLKGKGYSRYKTQSLVRITEDNLLQILNFQKHSHGDKRFTVNIAIVPLYIVKEHLTLQPGNRIGWFVGNSDLWFYYNSANVIKESFERVQQILIDNVLPCHENIKDSEALLAQYYTKKYPILFPVDIGWKTHLLVSTPELI